MAPNTVLDLQRDTVWIQHTDDAGCQHSFFRPMQEVMQSRLLRGLIEAAQGDADLERDGADSRSVSIDMRTDCLFAWIQHERILTGGSPDEVFKVTQARHHATSVMSSARCGTQ
jgi:hypothetical protein